MGLALHASVPSFFSAIGDNLHGVGDLGLRRRDRLWGLRHGLDNAIVRQPLGWNSTYMNAAYCDTLDSFAWMSARISVSFVYKMSLATTYQALPSAYQDQPAYRLSRAQLPGPTIESCQSDFSQPSPFSPDAGLPQETRRKTSSSLQSGLKPCRPSLKPVPSSAFHCTNKGLNNAELSCTSSLVGECLY